MRLFCTAAAILVVSSLGASAVPLAPDAGAIAARAPQAILRHEMHGCHYDCKCGPLKDFGCEQVYHRHLHMLCLPVRCAGDQKCEHTPPKGYCGHVAPQ